MTQLAILELFGYPDADIAGDCICPCGRQPFIRLIRLVTLLLRLQCMSLRAARRGNNCSEAGIRRGVARNRALSCCVIW